jgi:hypothetical protein
VATEAKTSFRRALKYIRAWPIDFLTKENPPREWVMRRVN